MNNINAITRFEREHFDASTVTVTRHNVDIFDFLGFELTSERIIRLSGAPTGSTIEVFRKDDWSYEEYGEEEIPPGIYFRVHNTRYIASQNEVGVFRDALPDRSAIFLKLIDFRPDCPSGLAGRMLAVMVRDAWILPGARRMTLFAAGGRTTPDRDDVGSRWGGYIAWPTYGFDMPLKPQTVALSHLFPYYPKGLAACRNVSDVLALEGGREYWRIAGDGGEMDFDLSMFSASIKRLDAFLERRGL